MKDPGSNNMMETILLDKMHVTFAKPNKNDKIEKETSTGSKLLQSS